MDGPVFQLLMLSCMPTRPLAVEINIFSFLSESHGMRPGEGRKILSFPTKQVFMNPCTLSPPHMRHICRWLLVGRDILTLFHNYQDHFPEVMTRFLPVMPGKVAVAPLTCWGMCTGKRRTLFHLLCLPVFVASVSHDWKELTSQSGSILTEVSSVDVGVQDLQYNLFLRVWK